MDFKKLQNYFKQNNISDFRLKQVKYAYYQEALSGWDQVTTLSLSLREDLKHRFPWLSVEEEKLQTAKDISKALLKLSDGLKTETVLMRYKSWITACISVMVGCPIGCLFCATGSMGFKRNLKSEEIVDQVVYWNQKLKEEGKRVSRVVFMGMGEPFLNWEEVKKAIEIINSPDGLGIGQRNITISTVGVTPKIRELVPFSDQINLAISLHSPFQNERERMIPIASKYPLGDLFRMSRGYVNRTRHKLFFEYALIKDFNDSEKDARELKKLFGNEKLFHLNIIDLNPTESGLAPTTPQKKGKFLAELKKLGIPFTIRRNLGEEIKAACGQLATK